MLEFIKPLVRDLFKNYEYEHRYRFDSDGCIVILKVTIDDLYVDGKQIDFKQEMNKLRSNKHGRK